MKATWELLEKNVVKFSVEVAAEQVEQAAERAFRKVSRTVSVPGFRKGKAPRAVFEKMYGTAAIYEEAADELLNSGYQEALRQSDFEPISRPEVTEMGELAKGQPFTFTIEVQVKPEVKLGALTGFDVKLAEAVVTDEDVDKEIERLLERNASLQPDEAGEVKEGSFAVIDFEGFLNDEPFEGGKGENFTLEIGSGTFIPGFEEQLVGAKVGETREIDVTFPEDYRAKELAGQKTMFRVTIHEVKTRVLPELTDEYVSTISPFKTVQELRADLTNRLTEAAKRQAQQDFQNELVAAVVAAAEVEVPEALISDQVHVLIHDLEHQLSHQGLTLEQYYEMTGKTHDDLHTDFHEPALERAKTALVLEAVAKQEQLSVSEAELEAELQKVIEVYGEPARQAAQNPQYRAQVKDSLLTQKVIEHLTKLNGAA